jgi:hypothetical protein
MQLSGFNSYVRLNVVLLMIGSSPIDNPPESALVTKSPAYTLIFNDLPKVALIATTNQATSNSIWYPWATGALAAGIGFVKTYLRLMIPAQVNSNGADFTAAWGTTFGAQTAGQRVSFTIGRADKTTGCLLAGTRVDATRAALTSYCTNVTWAYPVATWTFNSNVTILGTTAEPALKLHSPTYGWNSPAGISLGAANQVQGFFIIPPSVTWDWWRILTQPTKFSLAAGALQLPQGGKLPF